MMQLELLIQPGERYPLTVLHGRASFFMTRKLIFSLIHHRKMAAALRFYDQVAASEDYKLSVADSQRK